MKFIKQSNIIIMNNKVKKSAILSGSILASALTALTITIVEAKTINLGSGSELRSEIIDLNILSSAKSVYEMKCGSETTEQGKAKKTEKKAKEGKAVESKCGEGKCGEGKCGSSEKKSEKKTKEKLEKKATEKKESKCGAGKCGSE